MRLALLLVSFISIVSAKGQFILDKNNAPAENSYLYHVTDTLPQVSRGNAGTNQIWDFKDFDKDQIDSMAYFAANLHPSSVDFPTANLVFGGYLGAMFAVVSDTSFEVIGSAGDYTGTQTNTSVYFPNPETLNKYPVSLDSTWIDSALSDLTIYLGLDLGAAVIDSARLFTETLKLVSYDGTGTINTVNGNFPNVLREKALTYVKSYNHYCIRYIIPPDSACTWYDGSIFQEEPVYDSTAIYSWYNSNIQLEVAKITYDLATDTARSAVVTNDPSFTVAIAKRHKAEGGVFPNPAKDVLNITGLEQIESITLSDQLGKVVLQQSGDNKQINIDHLPTGVYLLNVRSAKGIYSEKITVNK